MPNYGSWKRHERSRSKTTKAISQTVSTEERVEIKEIPERFRQFWNAQETTARERKRAAHLLIEDVTVQKANQIVAQIRAHRGEPRRPFGWRFLRPLPSRV